MLKEVGLPPDVDVTTQNIHWTHRQCGPADVYFLSNQDAEDRQTEVTFRVTGKGPELWDPVTGEMRPLAEVRSSETRTTVPLRFTQPRATSWSSEPGSPARKATSRSVARRNPRRAVGRDFRSEMGPAGNAVFQKLDDWTVRSEEGIKYFSGTADYVQI